MFVDFLLRCVLCAHCATRSIPIELADDFMNEVDALNVNCTSPRCAEARSIGVGTMKIDRMFVLARTPGSDLHSMTQDHWSWITGTHPDHQLEYIPF